MERRNKVAEEVQEASREEAPQRKSKEVRPQDLYHTGSTLVNLACSGHWRGGFKLGTIVTMPGTSQSGKSILAETALAEGINDARFKDYDFVRDDAESCYNFDTSYLFGEGVAERVIEPPLGTSNTIQDFKANMLTVMRKGPCIYLLDSLDGLSSDEELEKEMRKALAQAKSKEAADKIAGSYGMEKAKIIGQILRMVNIELEKTRSLLIMTQQVRQNTSAGPFAKPYTTSGGEAPFFWSFHQVWLNKVGTLKLNELKVGTQVKAEVTKNKFSGKLRDVRFNIWYDYGVDDIRSMIDFLLDQGVWSKGGKSVVDAEELGVSGSCLADGRGTLMDAIADEGKVNDLKKLVAKAWNDREESVKLNRTPRF